MSEIKNVGLTITLIRHQKNITTIELAERCGFTTTMMEQIEQNETIPSLGHLIKVARALGVRLGTFLDDMDQLGPVVTRSGDIKRGTSFSNKNSNARLNLDFFPLPATNRGAIWSLLLWISTRRLFLILRNRLTRVKSLSMF